MSRILDFIRSRCPWRQRPDPNFDPSIWQFDYQDKKVPLLLLYPPEPKLGPNQIRSFIDPNKVYTIVEPKEPVSQ